MEKTILFGGFISSTFPENYFFNGV